MHCGQGLCNTAQRRCGEIHAEALAPDCHCAILGQVDVGRNLVILVANVALQSTHLNKARLLDRVGGEMEVMQQPSLLDKARSAI